MQPIADDLDEHESVTLIESLGGERTLLDVAPPLGMLQFGREVGDEPAAVGVLLGRQIVAVEEPDDPLDELAGRLRRPEDSVVVGQRGQGGVDRGPLGDWREGRNDLEPLASALAPQIPAVLAWLGVREGVNFVRMSGSGAIARSALTPAC